ncbi:hypothetical protein SALBM135S_05520 [Streptomyces alboniger]
MIGLGLEERPDLRQVQGGVVASMVWPIRGASSSTHAAQALQPQPGPLELAHLVVALADVPSEQPPVRLEGASLVVDDRLGAAQLGADREKTGEQPQAVGGEEVEEEGVAAEARGVVREALDQLRQGGTPFVLGPGEQELVVVPGAGAHTQDLAVGGDRREGRGVLGGEVVGRGGGEQSAPRRHHGVGGRGEVGGAPVRRASRGSGRSRSRAPGSPRRRGRSRRSTPGFWSSHGLASPARSGPRGGAPAHSCHSFVSSPPTTCRAYASPNASVFAGCVPVRRRDRP